MRPSSHGCVHVLIEKSLFLASVCLRRQGSLTLGRQIGNVASLHFMSARLFATYQFRARATSLLKLGHRLNVVDALPSLSVVLAELVSRLDDLSDSGLDPILPHRKRIAIAVESVLLHASSIECQLSVLYRALLVMQSHSGLVLSVSFNDVAHLALYTILMLLSLLFFLRKGFNDLSASKRDHLELRFNFLLDLRIATHEDVPR